MFHWVLNTPLVFMYRSLQKMSESVFRTLLNVCDGAILIYWVEVVTSGPITLTNIIVINNLQANTSAWVTPKMLLLDWRVETLHSTLYLKKSRRILTIFRKSSFLLTLHKLCENTGLCSRLRTKSTILDYGSLTTRMFSHILCSVIAET